jgi:hypothetical protein
MFLLKVSSGTFFTFDSVQYIKESDQVIKTKSYDGFMCQRTKDSIYVVLPCDINVYIKSQFGDIKDGTIFINDKGKFVKCTLPCGTTVGVNIGGQIVFNHTDKVFILS